MTNTNLSTKQQPFYVLTKYDILAIVAEESPRTAELLAEYGLHCISCYFSDQDTLEMGAKVHGMTDEELDDMIEEINEQLKTEWKQQFKSQNAKVKNTVQK